MAFATFFFYIALTIVNLPYLSWGAELSRDYAERMRVTGFRESATMAGVLLATSIPLFILAGKNPGIEDIVTVFATSILIILLLGILLSGVWAIPVVFLLFNYPIDEKRHNEIRKQLQERGASNV